jgi:hypothetical protein
LSSETLVRQMHEMIDVSIACVRTRTHLT